MLAGLQSQVDTLFPNLRLTPEAQELQDGENKAAANRIVRISGYKTEIFDMHNAKQRAAYDKRMMDLSVRVQMRTAAILVHDRQLMTRKDGSTGWFGYLEWMEYAWEEADGSVRTESKKKEK